MELEFLDDRDHVPVVADSSVHGEQRRLQPGCKTLAAAVSKSQNESHDSNILSAEGRAGGVSIPLYPCSTTLKCS